MSDFKWRQREEEEAKPLKQHLAETCMVIKEAYKDERSARSSREFDEKYGRALPTFTERADRIRRNLMAVAAMVVFYKSYGLTISATTTGATTFFGLKINNLTPAAIDVGFTFLVAYLLAHFIVEGSRVNTRYFTHLIGVGSFSWIFAFIELPWRARMFVLESFIPVALGIWALCLLPFKQTLFWWYS